MTIGNVYGFIGAAIAVGLSCLGSAIGMSRVGQSGAGLLSKNPQKFTEVLILQLIPSTNGLYGFVVAFLAIFAKINIMGGDAMAAMTEFEGLSMLMICLPIGIVGLLGAIVQANVCVSGISLIGKQDKQLVKALLMAAMLELFVLFSFIISVLGVLGMQVTMPGAEVIESVRALII